jgi:hypothetical protein
MDSKGIEEGISCELSYGKEENKQNSKLDDHISYKAGSSDNFILYRVENISERQMIKVKEI